MIYVVTCRFGTRMFRDLKAAYQWATDMGPGARIKAIVPKSRGGVTTARRMVATFEAHDAR